MNRPNLVKLRRLRSRGLGWQRGQNLVELALCMTVLSLVLLVASDFGRMFYAAITVYDAARAGAQFGSQSLITAANTAGITSAATKDATNLTLSSGYPTASQCTCVSTSTTVAICASSYNCSDNPQATYVTVTVAAPFTTLVSYPGLPNPVTLTGTAKMQILQ
jgi:Flp pilus assembly protein TadG